MSERIIPASMQSFYDSFHFAPAVVDGDHVRCSGVIGINLEDGTVPDDPGRSSGLHSKISRKCSRPPACRWQTSSK